MEANLSQPGLAFLWDHRVAGRELFPAAAMLELATAAVAAIAAAAPKERHPALVGVSIPAPLSLPAATTKLPIITVRIGRAGELAVESASGARQGPWQAHLRASITAAPKASGEFKPGWLGGLLEAPVSVAACGFVAPRAGCQPQEFLTDPARLDCCTQVTELQQHSSIPDKFLHKHHRNMRIIGS